MLARTLFLRLCLPLGFVIAVARIMIIFRRLHSEGVVLNDMPSQAPNIGRGIAKKLSRDHIQSNASIMNITTLISASWLNTQFVKAIDQLWREVVRSRRNITVASVGGSASAGKITYLHQFCSLLQTFVWERSSGNVVHDLHVHGFNPSAGHTGSVWGALHLDALIPRETDIILWEFAINDMNPESAGLSPNEFHQQAFELFLRRVLAFNPNIIVGIVSLWRPHARSCWPCVGDSASFLEVITVASCYAHLPVFAIDGNELGSSLKLPRSSVFNDSHHPSPRMHQLLGSALFTHVYHARVILPNIHNAQCPLQESPMTEVSVQAGHEPTVSFSELALQNDLLSLLLSSQHQTESLVYKKPVYGAYPDRLRQITTQAASSSGRNVTSRIDRQFFVEIPLCSGASPLKYQADFHHQNRHFVGLNLRGWQGKMLKDTADVNLAERLLSVNVTFPESLALQMIPAIRMRLNDCGVITRGIAEPQAWFVIPRHEGIAFPFALQICQLKRAYGLGSLVLV